MKNQVRFPELDLLRFLAACGVMLFHYTFRGPLDHAWSATFPVLSQIFKYGYLGVDVFFILSGFVILLTAYEKDAIAFAFARMVRLYPAYWLCVTLTAVAGVLAGRTSHPITVGQYSANLSMIHSFFSIRDVSGVYWTLAVELKFYFLIFLILMVRQIPRMSLLLGVWLLASVLLSLQAPRGVAWFLLFPEWSSYFIAGAMLFLIYREGVTAYKLSVLAACFGLSVAHALHLAPAAVGGLDPNLSGPVLVILLAVFYLTFLGIALHSRSGVPVAASSWAGRVSKSAYLLGLITYPLYLIHQELGYIFLRSAPAAMNRYLLLAIVIAAMIGLSWLVHVGPERWVARRLKALPSRLRRLGLALKSPVSDAGKFRPKTPLVPEGSPVVEVVSVPFVSARPSVVAAEPPTGHHPNRAIECRPLPAKAGVPSTLGTPALAGSIASKNLTQTPPNSGSALTI
jgi:peptidoglycan/LPS O-acetylase OafA/YrhL